MKLGARQHDLDSSPGQSLNGSFRKSKCGFLGNDFNSSPGKSLDGSFRKSNSVISASSISAVSTSSKFHHSSRRIYKGLKDFTRRFIDRELFMQGLVNWVLENSVPDSADGEPAFTSPFLMDELCKLDLALEGVSFQQLYRMPCSSYAPEDVKEDVFLAAQDFLHAIVNGLWRTFWRKSGQLPFSLSWPRHHGSKFYTLEKAISRGRLNELSGLALVTKGVNDGRVHWDDVAEFALFRSDILSENEMTLSPSSICEAIFYGVHMLVSRSLGKCDTISDSVYVLVLDSKFGGVVKLGGDISRLELNSTNVYQSVVEWIKHHAEVNISAVDQIWNKLGNANWGDVGTLQIILATFYSISQCAGPPRKSIASLASDHSLRLQKRWLEWGQVESHRTDAMVPYQNGEIVEVDEKQSCHLQLKQGELVILEDQRLGQRSFQIQDYNYLLYTAVSVDCPTKLLTLYVGAHPSRLEPSWEDMSLWYQVQRQTKVLNIFKQRNISSKHLPEIIASGRILHPGPCKKGTSHGRCDHPWCGTPILVTSPVGEPLSYIVARDGPLSSEEAIRCCRDCLLALKTAALANVQHGDICPENIIRVVNAEEDKYTFSYVLTSWGRAVLEDRDSPAINLQFSSSHALQNGKLCPVSDAESLIYMLYFVCGGEMEQQDSIESALQWRERSWERRVMQQKLGEVSALLKAFADYVDSLSGTYSVDYDIWLKRLNKAVEGSSERGKMLEQVAITLRLEDVAESSGTSGGI